MCSRDYEMLGHLLPHVCVRMARPSANCYRMATQFTDESLRISLVRLSYTGQVSGRPACRAHTYAYALGHSYSVPLRCCVMNVGNAARRLGATHNNLCTIHYVQIC
jgi:hypothetical protein